MLDLPRYHQDKRYWYYANNRYFIANSLANVPENAEDWISIKEAVSAAHSLGCWGKNLNELNSVYSTLILTALKEAVKCYGETFDCLYRGIKSNRTDNEYKILFGATNKKIAEYYGNKIKIYRNIRGLKTYSTKQSVLTEDKEVCDEEIIFFPTL